MKSTSIALSSRLDEVSEKRVYATVNTFATGMDGLYPYPNTGSRKRIPFVVGVALSLLWLLFVSLLSLSKGKRVFEVSPSIYIAEPLKLQNPPLYVTTQKPEMVQ